MFSQSTEIRQLVEAPFDAIAYRLYVAVNIDGRLSISSHRDHRSRASRLSTVPDLVRVIAATGDDDLGSGTAG